MKKKKHKIQKLENKCKNDNWRSRHKKETNRGESQDAPFLAWENSQNS